MKKTDGTYNVKICIHHNKQRSILVYFYTLVPETLIGVESTKEIPVQEPEQQVLRRSLTGMIAIG